MAKEKTSKKSSTKASGAATDPKARKPSAPAKAPKAAITAKAANADKAKKAARAAKDKAVELASNPVVAEVVAATLVAAAAALRNPAKAREIAAVAGDEIGNVVKGASGQGAALWQMAMDVARRSVDAVGPGSAGAKKKPKKKG